MRCLLALLLLGCETAPAPHAPPPSPAPEAAPSVSIPDLFPVRIGNRWRERAETGVRTRGVTAHTPTGLWVFFGQGDTRPAFHRVDEQELALTTPDGEAILPMLRAPIREGASWTYTGAAPCNATFTSTGASRETAGVTLEGCATVEHVCEHPVGGPFEAPTVRTTRETYCPGVGRVSSSTTLDPPLEGTSGTSAVEVVYWRVGDAPIAPRPDPFDCDGALLLPSDVQAACGSAWRWVGEERVEDGCAHRFERGAPSPGTAEIRITAHGEHAATVLDELFSARGVEPDVRPRLFERTTAGPDGFLAGDHQDGFVVTLSTSEQGGCAHSRRLFPLLRSLVTE